MAKQYIAKWSPVFTHEISSASRITYNNMQFYTWREIMGMNKYSSMRSLEVFIHLSNNAICMINFTTANIYNLHVNTPICDL